MINKIISGGQTGGDIGGILAAIDLGIEYGGTCPAAYKNELGFDKRLLYWGFECTKSSSYPPRTRINVVNSDGTIGFGNMGSAGMKLTANIADDCDKTMFMVHDLKDDLDMLIEDFVKWASFNEIETLNVAGNRESKNPGIQEFTRKFLVAAIKELNGQE